MVIFRGGNNPLKEEERNAWKAYKESRSYGHNHQSSLDALVAFNDVNSQYSNFAISSRGEYERGLIDKIIY